MRLSFEGERILAVMAHPDDADLMCAGTLERAHLEGAEVGIVYLCMGDKGQPDPPIPHLADVRHAEALRNAEAIGARLIRGIFDDGSLADTPAAREFLLATYRDFRPTLVLSHPLEDYHADHRAAAALAEAATWFSASKGFVLENSPPLPAPPALWWCDTFGMTGFTPTLYVDVSVVGPGKIERLNNHASQRPRGAGGQSHPFAPLLAEQMGTRGREAMVTYAEAFRPYHTYKRTRAW
jgi:LmbE family N-acetylglucosaminyl deacetylase